MAGAFAAVADDVGQGGVEQDQRFGAHRAVLDAAERERIDAGLKQVLDYAFGPLSLHRIEANIQPGNAASIALARGAGFRLEGYSPRYLLIGGQWRDHERYALTVDERVRNGARR